METTFPRRFLVRAGAVAALLFYFPSPFDSIPVAGEAIWAVVVKGWLPLVKLAGRALGTAEPVYAMTGSGDTLFDWLRLFCILVLAVLLGLAWAFDKKRTPQAPLEDLLLDYLRLMLLVAMFSYGWSKVSLSQFPPLADWRLAQTYAESSPMGLLWRFMAFSPAYERFAGGLEVLAAALLVSRRTAVLGALVAMGVMANVVMLNFCFDVPVKNYSAVLWLTAAAIAAPSAGRVFRALVLGRAVEAAELSPKYLVAGKRRWVRMAPFGVFAAASLSAFLPMGDAAGPPVQQGPFSGEYVVVDQTAGARAQWVSITDWSFKLKRAEGAPLQLMCKQSKEEQQLTLSSAKTPDQKVQLKIEPAGDGRFRLTGELEGAPLDVVLLRPALEKQDLLARGFHWVQPFPYNR